VDAVDIPVIAAGGFFDGRGLAAALSYGAAGVGMGTRFLLTSDSAVPEAIKRKYLTFGLDGTVVTIKADGMPHRLLRTDFINDLEAHGNLGQLAPTIRRSFAFKSMSGLSWPGMVKDALSMKRSTGRSWGQMMLAANTPMMLKAGLVEGDLDAGMLAAGQVVGVIDDLPSCEELVDRIIEEATERIRAIGTTLV
jgi:NAD(P)H-dependent flavin oxidoreductase YrpB (nitropropane dioxygenase family)